MSDLQRETAELEKANLSSVNTIAQKYAAPNSTMLLLVGDLSKIESGVREPNLGEKEKTTRVKKMPTKNIRPLQSLEGTGYF